jgi:hypothetical protein
VTYDALAQQLGRTRSVVARRGGELGCAHGGAANAARSLNHRVKEWRKPTAPVEKVKPRHCLRCRTLFDPPTRFHFLCDTHRRGDE